MKSKLTLTVEKSLIEEAKQYAQERSVSLSELIESQLKKLMHTAASPSLATRLRGSAAGPLSNRTDKEIWEEMMEDRLKR